MTKTDTMLEALKYRAKGRRITKGGMYEIDTLQPVGK